MTAWPAETIEQIAGTDDLHIAPYRSDGKTTGTLTWIWSVVVDGRLFVRAYNGTRGRWYRSAVAQRAGRITAAGQEHTVAFAPVDDPDLNERIDRAYREKYAGSPYLPPMVAAGPRAATVEITPRGAPDTRRVRRPSPVSGKEPSCRPHQHAMTSLESSGTQVSHSGQIIFTESGRMSTQARISTGAPAPITVRAESYGGPRRKPPTGIESSSSDVLVEQVVRNTDPTGRIIPRGRDRGRVTRARPRVTPTIHQTRGVTPVARAPQETIELLNDYFGALEAKDFDRLRAFYADDVALTFANHPTITGAENVLALMADLAGKLDRIEHRLLRLWQEDDGVVVLEVRCIYHLNDSTVIEITACSIFVMADGRFADMRLYVDHAPVDAVLG